MIYLEFERNTFWFFCIKKPLPWRTGRTGNLAFSILVCLSELEIQMSLMLIDANMKPCRFHVLVPARNFVVQTAVENEHKRLEYFKASLKTIMRWDDLTLAHYKSMLMQRGSRTDWDIFTKIVRRC